MSYEITRPHRYELIYKDEKLEISFELEMASDGIIFYEDSGKIDNQYVDIDNMIIDRVRHWLSSKYENVYI